MRAAALALLLAVLLAAGGCAARLLDASCDGDLVSAGKAVVCVDRDNDWPLWKVDDE